MPSKTSCSAADPTYAFCVCTGGRLPWSWQAQLAWQPADIIVISVSIMQSILSKQVCETVLAADTSGYLHLSNSGSSLIGHEQSFGVTLGQHLAWISISIGVSYYVISCLEIGLIGIMSSVTYHYSLVIRVDRSSTNVKIVLVIIVVYHSPIGRLLSWTILGLVMHAAYYHLCPWYFPTWLDLSMSDAWLMLVVCHSATSCFSVSLTLNALIDNSWTYSSFLSVIIHSFACHATMTICQPSLAHTLAMRKPSCPQLYAVHSAFKLGYKLPLVTR